MWTIVRWTLWQRRWSLFWWCIGIIVLIVVTLAVYPSIRDQAAQLNKSFGGLSQSTLALFGGTNFFSPVGYLNSQLIYFTFPLLLTILGIGIGCSLLGREESEGTLEALLARPVSRSQLLAAKAIAGILSIFLVTLVGTAVTLLMAKAVNLAVPLGDIAAACFACCMLVLSFSAVAFLLTATGRGRGGALGVSATYAIGGYVIGSLASTVHWLKVPSLIFPYHYYRTADILRGSFDWMPIIFFAVFAVACGFVAWLSFRRRDIA